MSKHSHIANHTIHRTDKSGKVEVIKPNEAFTPVDKAQAEYLAKEGAARINAEFKAADPESTDDGTGKKGAGKKGAGKPGTEDDSLL